jgi:hypothetical protein
MHLLIHYSRNTIRSIKLNLSFSTSCQNKQPEITFYPISKQQCQLPILPKSSPRPQRIPLLVMSSLGPSTPQNIKITVMVSAPKHLTTTKWSTSTLPRPWTFCSSLLRSTMQSAFISSIPIVVGRLPPWGALSRLYDRLRRRTTKR